MKDLLAYQSEVAVCMAAFFALYILLWRNETNFQFKRLLLLSITTLSISIPLLDFTITMEVPQSSAEYLVYIPDSFIATSPGNMAAPPVKISVWNIVGAIWIIGACFMLIRFGISLWKIWRINNKATASSDGEYKIVQGDIQSFSFFNIIVINQNQVESEAKTHILAHEKAHSRQFHSIDVLYLELTKILQWFNPVCWVVARAVKQNLEFLADQIATRATNNKQEYQYAIVHHAKDSGYQMLKSQFSKSNLKQRILMMNHPNNNKVGLGKLMLLFPMILVLLMSFSIKVENLDIKRELDDVLPSVRDIEQFLHSDTTFEVHSIVDELPIPESGSMDKYYEEINKNLAYPAKALKKGIKGIVYVEVIIEKDGNLTGVVVRKGISKECDKEAVRLIKEGPSWIPGKIDGQFVNTRYFIPIAFGQELPRRDPSVQGIVNNADGDPIEGAKVSINGTSNSAKTNSDGEFQLDMVIDNKTRDLIISKPGYESQAQAVHNGTFLVTKLKEIKNERRKIQGKVMDESGNMVVACQVTIKGTNERTLTDGNGDFAIGVAPENTHLIFQYAGLQTKEISIGAATSIGVVLEEDEDFLTASEDIIQSKRNVAVSSTLIANMNSIKIGKPVYVENKTSDNTNTLMGTVKDAKGNPIIGCNVIIKGTHIGTITDREGRFAVVTEPTHTELIFSYVGMLTQIVEISDEMEYDITMKVDEDYKDRDPMIIRMSRGLANQSESKRDSIATVMIRGDQGQPMYIVDGVEQEMEALGKLNPSDIESINVIKGSGALDKFGSKGENGVILITTKSGNESADDIIKNEKATKRGRNSNIINNIVKDPKNPPLFIVDGKELSEDEIADLEPNNIESISVLKDKSATEIYGEKGKNGVIIIKTKN